LLGLGGGGGGGAGCCGNGGTNRNGGCGGGGAAMNRTRMPSVGYLNNSASATDIMSASETVTVGAGGAIAAGRNTAGNGTNGNNGADTTFGPWFKALKGT